MQLYKLYEAEKYGRKVISDSDGFITYNMYDDGSMYINTLFVKSEARMSGKGKELEDRAIEKEKPDIVICDIDLNANNPEQSLAQIIFKAGYKILRLEENKIVLYRKIEWK